MYTPCVHELHAREFCAKVIYSMKMKDIAERLTKYYDRLRSLYDVMDEEQHTGESSGTSLDFLTDNSTPGLSMKVLTPKSSRQQQPRKKKVSLLPMYDSIVKRRGTEGNEGEEEDEEEEEDSKEQDEGDDDSVMYTMAQPPAVGYTDIDTRGSSEKVVSSNNNSSNELIYNDVSSAHRWKEKEEESSTDGNDASTATTSSDDDDDDEEEEKGSEVAQGKKKRETASMIGQQYEGIILSLDD